MEPIPILGEFVEMKDMEALVDAIRKISVKEFKDDPLLDINFLGLGADGLEMTLADEEKEETLRIGKEEPAKEAYYTKRKDADTILMVSSSHLKDIFLRIEQMSQKSTSKQTELPLPPPAPAAAGAASSDADQLAKEIETLK
jgi:hypothetical protein